MCLTRCFQGGFLIGAQGVDIAGGLDAMSVVQVSWYSEIEWRFGYWEEVNDEDRDKVWAARQHHDFQREGNTVGYSMLLGLGHWLMAAKP